MYVITGASGNTGGIVARKLLESGKQVRAIGRTADRLRALTSLGAEPYTCDLTDREALIKAFTGATAAYVMVPPDMSSQNFRARQDEISDSIVAALERTKVKYAVSLSSIGADKSDKTGPIVGLHELEQKLNNVAALNVQNLRAGYFMENWLSQVDVIKMSNITAEITRPDIKIPIIATRDIGKAAADHLIALDFEGKQTRELQGQRDLTMVECTAIIAAAIKKPDLRYVQMPDEQFRNVMTKMGVSEEVANLLIEMAHAMNTGLIKTLEPRSPRNTTPTSFETFVKEEFLPRYEGKAASTGK